MPESHSPVGCGTIGRTNFPDCRYPGCETCPNLAPCARLYQAALSYMVAVAGRRHGSGF